MFTATERHVLFRDIGYIENPALITQQSPNQLEFSGGGKMIVICYLFYL